MRKTGFGFVLFTALVCAQKFEYWPGVAYDPSIPTARAVLDLDIGGRVLSHANLIRYTEALAAAAPRRMKVFDYAKSWEGRRLIYAAIGSEENIRRLPEIKAAMQRLYDPRKTPAAEARKIMANLPAVVWLGYGVHGNEISSPDAALQTMYHLLAARNDKMVAEILANTVVLIDPTQNPDGRDRFVNHYDTAEGLEPDPNPAAAEHNEPWPGGRTNHYYFDLNRDWLAITQPETAGRIKALREWYPLVFVDLHEMGTESTYYFAPEAVPYNPHLTKDQKEPLDWFGKNNAKYFDQFGFRYFTREVYDAFFPGYGASWPAYYGGIAMTYENGSTRGLVVRRNSDDTTITFRETVRRHFVASVATCETAAKNRARLLENFYQYHVTAIEEGGKEPVKEYILPRRGNVSAVDRLASLMVSTARKCSAPPRPSRTAAPSIPPDRTWFRWRSPRNVSSGFSWTRRCRWTTLSSRKRNAAGSGASTARSTTSRRGRCRCSSGWKRSGRRRGPKAVSSPTPASAADRVRWWAGRRAWRTWFRGVRPRRRASWRPVCGRGCGCTRRTASS